MRILTLISAFVLVSLNAYAIDWKSIGKPVEDDTTAMEERYVHFDGNTTDKNVPLDKAVLDSPDIQEWLSQRVAEVMKLDGPKYEQQITVNKRHFTEQGYGNYLAALEAAQIPKLLKEQHYTMAAVLTNLPNVYAKGLRELPDNKGTFIYVWRVEVPVTLNYQSINGSSNYKVYLQTELVRIPMREDGTLVAIDSWEFNAKPLKTTP
jgi:hypothetical protein